MPAGNAVSSSGRLPIPRTRLIGRERDIESVCARLGRDDVALLTLTGAGGVGKTRLALSVAERLQAEFDDGVYFVPLASISDPDLVASAIIQSLDLRPLAGYAPEDMLGEFLQSRRVLLVLDNFEQVLPATELISSLLLAAPSLVILVTSRVMLRVYGEHDFLVTPLGLPDLESFPTSVQLETVEAIQLFVERAQAVKHDFVLTPDNAPAVATICARLDGLPLAIELAAARIRFLSPHAILDRMEHRLPLLIGGPRDQPARQQTMRETIAWSYNLLDEHLQRLFRQLSVFVGGWALEAAEYVCDVGSDMLEGLSTLVDHNLVRQIEQPDGSTRCGMLETIREFGLERMEESGEAQDTRQRHARFFLDLATRAVPGLESSEQPHWLNVLEDELDNLRVALDWAVEHDADSALRSAGGLCRFWLVHAHLIEGRRWLEMALATGTSASEPVRAAALHAAGRLASWQGDFERTAELFEESLSMFREVGDRAGIANALRGLCRMEMAAGNFQRADDLGRECLAIYREIADSSGLMAAVGNLGWNTLGLGGLERGRMLLEESLTLAREHGNRAMAVNYLAGLAFVDLDLGDVEPARQQFIDSLALSAQMNDNRFIALCFEGLGRVATTRKQAARAASLFGAAYALRQTIGYPVEGFLDPQLQRDTDIVRSTLGDERFAIAWNSGQVMTLNDAVEFALASLPERPDTTTSLSPRELDVLRLIVDGMSDREIATRLFISHHTVNRHVSNILNKLGLESRTAAAAYAVRHDLA